MDRQHRGLPRHRRLEDGVALNPGSDATQPVITATAVDQWGTSTSESIQIIVWIPSDT